MIFVFNNLRDRLEPGGASVWTAIRRVSFDCSVGGISFGGILSGSHGDRAERMQLTAKIGSHEKGVPVRTKREGLPPAHRLMLRLGPIFYAHGNNKVSPAPAPATEARARSWSRTAAVDFIRGFGLWAVYLDHITPNILAHVTPWRYGFSDFAEIFVFLSGFIGVASYQRAFEAGNPGAVPKKLARRMARLYVAHVISLGVSMSVLALFARHGICVSDGGLYAWMQDPARYALRALTLTWAPVAFSLLPLYIVISPILLLATIGLRRAPALTFVVSGALWLACQIPAVDARLTVPVLFLHPLAWQFLFVLGAGARFYSDRLRKLALSPWIVRSAAVMVAASLGLRCISLLHHFIGVIPDPQWIPGTGVGKQHLAFYRLFHLLALAVVVHAWVSLRGLKFKSTFAQLVAACGADSLVVYCIILTLDVGASLLLALTHGGMFLQVQLSLYGIALFCGIAWARRRKSHAEISGAAPAEGDSGRGERQPSAMTLPV